MAAITSVEIENFRCFEKLRVDGLAQVNLIVGANNAGKTVLLEAIEAVVSRDVPLAPLRRASLERNEYRRRRGADDEEVEIDLRHWFRGHALSAGAAFRIHAASDHDLDVSWRLEKVPIDQASSRYVPGGLRLVAELRPNPDRPTIRAVLTCPITADGWLKLGALSDSQTVGLLMDPPVGFVPTGRSVPGDLASLWTKVELTPAEQRTVDALRLIEPRIERIAISESDGAKVLLRGAMSPVPLGSLGEGVSRILALALHVALTPGGFLLVDEIENGLHWSVMPKIWRFLVAAAIANQTQIFAVTHSKDWLEGLADLHRRNPELAAHVAVHRLQAGQETSIQFDAERIAEYVEMEMEAR
jgi:putative AbiEii toxin of type IV toxin-antitoxin system/AAA ATPase-like protein